MTSTNGQHRLPTLLIVEDDEDLRLQLRWALAPEYEVFEAGDRAAALEVIRTANVGLVMLDLGLPPDADGASEGLKALEDMMTINHSLKIIMVTGNSDRANAIKAVELGAYDFLEKPVELEVLKVVLQRAYYLVKVERENQELRSQNSAEGYDVIIGSSAPMQKVFEIIRRVAKSDISVLIVGESGTGKELIAGALHRQGDRADGPFVAINCGAIPEMLLESELFGHEKGAFTGAHIRRKGRIESAHGGTLFLDEIGELYPALQVKLLRVLQERSIERVGGRETIAVDARVVAATNIDLQLAMAEGRFREDLYYRLNTITVSVPPLRDRGADILMLAERFLRNIATGAKKKLPGFTKEAKMSIDRYNWPGNVRELENRIKRAVAMSDGPKVTPEDLQLEGALGNFTGNTLRQAREAVEKELIQRTLEKTRGNITRAAVELGVSRPTLHEMISRYALRN